MIIHYFESRMTLLRYHILAKLWASFRTFMGRNLFSFPFFEGKYFHRLVESRIQIAHIYIYHKLSLDFTYPRRRKF